MLELWIPQFIILNFFQLLSLVSTHEQAKHLIKKKIVDDKLKEEERKVEKEPEEVPIVKKKSFVSSKYLVFFF